MKQNLIFGLIVIVLATLSACSSSEIAAEENSPVPNKVEAVDPVVARINDLEFSQSELERELAIDRATYKLTNGRDLILQDLARTLQDLISTLLLDQQARQAGIIATDDEITVALSKFVAGRRITINDLEAELTRQDITLADFRENLGRNVRIEKYLDEAFIFNTGEQIDFATWFRDLRESATIEILYEPPEELPMMGAIAPDFTLTNLEGEAVTLSQFRGRPVVINFWATWCVPCRNEMPAFQRAFEAHQEDELVILAVDFEEEANLVRPFVEEFGLTFEILYDTQATVSKTYQVTGLPRTIFVDRQGVIQHIQVGEVKEELLAGFLEKIL